MWAGSREADSQALFVALSPGVVLVSAGTALREAFLGSKSKICDCCAGGCFALHLSLDTSHCSSTSTVIKPETFSHPRSLSSCRTRRLCGVSCRRESASPPSPYLILYLVSF